MTPPQRLVIVGASLAGMRAAQAARTAGFDGELVIIGDEPHMPYTRPPLSKQLLSGEHDRERVDLTGADKLDADWRLGVAATALDRVERQVVLDGGERVGYDRVILATGSRPRPWPGEGGDLAGVHTLRTVDDALALRDLVDAGKPLAIVGAGFIGTEVAATARSRGCAVTLIDVAELPLTPLGEELGRRVAERHRDEGVELRLGAGVSALAGDADGRVAAVELEGGERIEASDVLIALGALPNVEWLAGSGLEMVAGGVACEMTLTSTVDPDVLVAGDIAAPPHPLAHEQDSVRIEHWASAAKHGQLAGHNALLDPDSREPNRVPPFFWSDQYDMTIQSAGLFGAGDEVVVLEELPEAGGVVLGALRDGMLVGAAAINGVKHLARYRTALAGGPAELPV